MPRGASGQSALGSRPSNPASRGSSTPPAGNRVLARAAGGVLSREMLTVARGAAPDRRAGWRTGRTLLLFSDLRIGASGRTRTCNLLIRSQKLYPIELRTHSLAGRHPGHQRHQAALPPQTRGCRYECRDRTKSRPRRGRRQAVKPQRDRSAATTKRRGRVSSVPRTRDQVGDQVEDLFPREPVHETLGHR